MKPPRKGLSPSSFRKIRSPLRIYFGAKSGGDDDDDDDIRFCIAALRPVTAYVAATYLYTSYVCTTGVGDEM